MPLSPLVVKLGGDALASPERIATEARRLARLAGPEPPLPVTSARRGVTDHLLGLVEGVRSAVGDSSGAHAEADRAVAAGEIVTASLLALALNDLSVQAVSLDARESGIRVAGSFGDARIQAIASGWRRGRVATLGDGGTDTSAVARAVGIGASRALDHVLSILVGTSQAVEATGAVHGAFVRQRSDNVVPARRAS
jgi:aspartate kinase